MSAYLRTSLWGTYSAGLFWNWLFHNTKGKLREKNIWHILWKQVKSYVYIVKELSFCYWFLRMSFSESAYETFFRYLQINILFQISSDKYFISVHGLHFQLLHRCLLMTTIVFFCSGLIYIILWSVCLVSYLRNLCLSQDHEISLSFLLELGISTIFYKGLGRML